MEVEHKKTFSMLEEILEIYDFTTLIEKLYLHPGTIKRWIENKKVPTNYYNDLNSLLGNKYPADESYRSKDQFYTSDVVAKYCYNKTQEVLSNMGIDTNNYIYIEPSAGCCNFYDLLPEERRIGVDIEPKGANSCELIEKNYLEYYPENKGKYIVLGNPPFGLRGNLALRFINHSAAFADFVAFILPPLFDSTGKGVPMKRVKGYKLIHTEKLPLDSYYYPNGEKISIATIFQIWSKLGDVNLADKTAHKVDEYLKIYSLSNGNNSGARRNVKMIGKCDAYLPSTCFNGMKAYRTFEELPNKRGYGVVFKKNQVILKDAIFNAIDWEKVAFLSTNSALNLRSDLIIEELKNRGLLGEK